GSRALQPCASNVAALGAPATIRDLRSSRFSRALPRVTPGRALAIDQPARASSFVYLRLLGHLESPLRSRRQYLHVCSLPDGRTASLVSACGGCLALDHVHSGSAQSRKESCLSARDFADGTGVFIVPDSGDQYRTLGVAGHLSYRHAPLDDL